MRQDRETPFNPDQPTLVVTYGNTTRKHRPLDRDVIVLGRSPSCDLNLMGAEVAPIHCLLLRCAGGGWRVRHFGGRIGTLVNGRPVQDAVVDHDDALQIGSFSFKFHLPAPFRRPGLTCDVAPDSAEASHLRRSRRNLARLALNLRTRLHETAAELARAQKHVDQQEQDLDALRATARSRQEALDTMGAQRETEERDFLQRSQALQGQEAILAERLRCLEAEIARQREQAPRPGAAPSEEAKRLDRRGVELAHYARHLRRAAVRIAGREAELAQLGDKLLMKRDSVRCDREETPPENERDRIAALPVLRERLAVMQIIKVGLAMARTNDSAPGAAADRALLNVHQTAGVPKETGDTPADAVDASPRP
jgi:pSer/pThr/pTyr-binding forkhead associated (FHA) protein